MRFHFGSVLRCASQSESVSDMHNSHCSVAQMLGNLPSGSTGCCVVAPCPLQRSRWQRESLEPCLSCFGDAHVAPTPADKASKIRFRFGCWDRFSCAGTRPGQMYGDTMVACICDVMAAVYGFLIVFLRSKVPLQHKCVCAMHCSTLGGCNA